MDRESQYDLLTAAVLGVALGAAATLLIGAGMRRPEPHPIRSAIARSGRQGLKRAGSALSPDTMRLQVAELMDSARDAVTDAVESELKDLRRSIKRKRRRLGI
ncbi:MAG TPA: hypothetical protein VGE02_09255 [Gemmatimonadales bacterium]